MITLYGNLNSGHSYKVALYLALSDIPYTYQYVDLNISRDERSKDFQKHSQFGEVPVLVDGDTSICQSNVILEYLAQKTGHFAGDNLKVKTWLAWEANRIGMSLPNLRFESRFKSEPDLAVIDYFRKRVIQDLGALNNRLSLSDFIVGNELTIADFSICGYLFWLDEVDIEINEWPHIKNWLQSIRAQSGWRPAYDLMAQKSPD